MPQKEVELLSSKSLAGILLIICLGTYGMGYIMEHTFGVQACTLCHYERNVFLAGAAIAFIGFLAPKPSRYWMIVILGFVFFIGFGLASYHVAIQQHWVSLPTFCAANDFSAFDSVESLKEQLLQTPFVRCDQVTWSLFGFSLATYNAIFSLILSGVCWGWVWKQK